MSIPVPIIDSHIHLFPASELSTLAWNEPSHPLWKQHSLTEYRRAVSSSHDLLSGFIFLETDRRTTPDDGSSDDAAAAPPPDPTAAPEQGGYSWKYPLQEVSFLARLAAGRPRDVTEGHAAHDKDLCLGIVPWAPMPAGPAVLARYLDAVRATALRDGDEGVWAKIKGFRYLLQDKPDGTMLAPAFIEALKLLGRRGLVFDVGVDQHHRGRKQLEEAVEMIERAHEGIKDEEKVVFILNHLCKPDLTVLDPADPSFIAWRTAIYTLSKADNVYMKLSGAFSEMPPSLQRASANDIFEAISPWLAVVVAAFGPERIMFGSDWPVCTVGVDAYTNEDPSDGDNNGETDDNGGAWDKWRKVVERLCFMSSFSEEETKMIFWGTAKRAYGIQAGKIY